MNPELASTTTKVWLTTKKQLTTAATQALWALLTALPVYAANAVTHQPPLGVTDAVGALLWCVGLTVETMADSQKKAFRRLPANRHKWIDTGLWAWSRHPNYFGAYECVFVCV